MKHEQGLEFPNLPYYIDEDVKITETIAIMRYICVKHQPSLLGKTPEDQGTVEMLAGVLTELFKQATLPCYFGDLSKE